ncbi:MAG: GT2 family glycosyltransferase [Vicingaceae bacterium]|jgi:GT2 family glycosyltransferase
MEKINIAAVVVLYNEEIESSKTYNSLLKNSQFPVFVYDNSSLKQKTKGKEGFTIVFDTSNPGVSKAYNQAWKWAEQNKYTHLLLLDSDSTFPENSESKYIEAVNNYPEKIIIPSMISNKRKISPFYFKFGKSHYGDNISFGKIQLGKIVAINSGLVVPVNAFRKTGGYNEKLPLDWSDVFFIRKASAVNVEAFHIPLEVGHGLSEHTVNSLKSTHFRFKTQLKGISLVALSALEKYQMYFWMALKSIKLSIRYRSFWFLANFFKR